MTLYSITDYTPHTTRLTKPAGGKQTICAIGSSRCPVYVATMSVVVTAMNNSYNAR